MGWLFMPVGMAAGAFQALLLARQARADAGPFGVLLRLLGVGVVLFASALFGHLMAGADGWAAGLAITGILLMQRLR